MQGLDFQGQGKGPEAKAIKFGFEAFLGQVLDLQGHIIWPRGHGMDRRSQGQGTGPEAKATAIKFGVKAPRGL